MVKRDEELEMLMGVLDRLGVEVRIEACEGDGGLAHFGGKSVLFLSRIAAPVTWKRLCIEALRRSNTSSVHLPPRVRQVLGEGEWEENGGRDADV
jgi:hypothetical protein